MTSKLVSMRSPYLQAIFRFSLLERILMVIVILSINHEVRGQTPTTVEPSSSGLITTTLIPITTNFTTNKTHETPTTIQMTRTVNSNHSTPNVRTTVTPSPSSHHKAIELSTTPIQPKQVNQSSMAITQRTTRSPFGGTFKFVVNGRISAREQNHKLVSSTHNGSSSPLVSQEVLHQVY